MSSSYVSLFERRSSPRLYAAYWDPVRQKRVQKVTPFRKDDPQSRRKALRYCQPLSQEAKADKHSGGQDRWERWVPEFIDARYRNSPKTLRRYEGAWSQWYAFLIQEQLRIPRALDYNAVLRFIDWRTGQVKPSSGKRVSRNSALCDVKLMSVVMREAMRRGFADSNHCEKLGIRKDPPKQKPEMSAAEIAAIRAALQSRPKWMRISFEIALHQGCRLSETSIPMGRVDLIRKTITFFAKGRGGGGKNVFTTKLHPDIEPMMRDLAASGVATTCSLPQMAAKEWHTFFGEIGLPHLCFHCTRVTVITRMARAGVPISQAMAYVGHASETIHRIYQRLAAADLSPAVAALSF